ncbi:DUF3795 domain-containing protein [bacterium]|nr:DUF3795 domain-containing protein [bacterium]
MEVNQDFLAPCGLYCGVCGMYYATRDNNEPFLEKLVGVYQGNLPGVKQLTPQDLKCKGCLSDTVSVFCQVCNIKTCAREKGIAGCHECDDFPCQEIDHFPIAVGKKVILRAVPYWREHGTEKWVAAEEARYTCPECSHKLFRGAKRCNHCKTPVDVD